ncbi:MAG: hypothetical protein ABFD07_19710, partial [Methanobacterium sp.]
KMQLKHSNASYSIEEIFDNKNHEIVIERIDHSETKEEEPKHKEISIEELSLKYETLLDKMMRSTD